MWQSKTKDLKVQKMVVGVVMGDSLYECMNACMCMWVPPLPAPYPHLVVNVERQLQPNTVNPFLERKRI